MAVKLNLMTSSNFLLALAVTALTLGADPLADARNRQDRGYIRWAVTQADAAAKKNPKDAAAQYRLAVTQSIRAEVALEVHDKAVAQSAAEDGYDAAQRAVELQPRVAEYHRILGTLCGQVIPAKLWLAVRYGGCARTEITRAIELDAKSAKAYLSRGVGNYYLPSGMGGGFDLALRDFDKAIQLDPNLADAYLWRGIALRKLRRNAEAYRSIARSLQLNPGRVWAKEQLAKTPQR
jgi:tetratricopeptide (TPR) repeat protein